jgi:hypothetical protein
MTKSHSKTTEEMVNGGSALVDGWFSLEREQVLELHRQLGTWLAAPADSARRVDVSGNSGADRNVHLRGYRGDGGESEGVLSMSAVLDGSPNYPDSGRIGVVAVSSVLPLTQLETGRMVLDMKPATLHFDAQPRTIVGDLRDEDGRLLSSVQGATYGEVVQNATGRACAMGYEIVSHVEASS